MEGKWLRKAKLYLVVCSVRIRSSGLKLQHGKFHLSMWKNFFMVGVTEHWNRVSREVVDLLYGDIDDPSGCIPVIPIKGYHRQGFVSVMF